MRTFCFLLILVTSIRANAQQISRFMIVGDTHHSSPSPDLSKTLLYEITLAAIHEKVGFIFFTGDLAVRGFESPAEEDSVLKDWRFVLDTLQYHNIKVFACRGNNDLSSREAWDSLFSGPYLFPQNGPENEKNITYAIEYNNFLFIAMDQYAAFHKIEQVWLDSLLETRSSKFIFAAGHEPAFKLFNSSCLGAYPEERNRFWESLLKAGAKAYFCGHDHFYDHAIIEDGDGNTANNVHQVIAGTGGASFFSDSEYNGDNGRWTPVRLFHDKSNGYALIEVKDSVVLMTWKHRIARNTYAYGGDSSNFLTTSTDIIISKKIMYFLENYPNPFSSNTVISYELSAFSNIELSVFDPLGRKVTTLVNERQQPGKYEVDCNTEGMLPGIYFCQLKAGDKRQIIKMIMLR
jgi:predicted phosphodiesterase